MSRPLKRSVDRILTTHTGSLPRPVDLLEMIRRREAGEVVDEAAFAARVTSAVADTVRRQVDAGVDVVSDGEMGKPNCATYVAQRLTGIGGVNPDPRPFAEWEEFPEWAAGLPASS